jgi:hypothetical protein
MTNAHIPDYLVNAAREHRYQRAKAAAQASWQSLVHTREPHAKQTEFIDSTAKRRVIRAGRRSGKTVGIAIYAVRQFLKGRRVLYATPTQEQVDAFWYEVKHALERAIDSGALYKNETLHLIEVQGTKNRIRAKTAWNADTLRGDYADDLILDEYQLMSEDAWARVGQPMLLQSNGDAAFIYTPPSIHSRSATKAKDPRHASKLFKMAAADESGIWETFHFTSYDNPFNERDGLALMAEGMTRLAFEQEIMAEDTDDVAGALWKHETIELSRVNKYPELVRIVIGVDPTGGVAEAGIIAAGLGVNGHGYLLGDYSLAGTPKEWSNAVVSAYHIHKADRIVAEKNFGGAMVESTIRGADKDVSYKDVNSSRGKALRAEPIAALYERGMIHHVGKFDALEDEYCSWIPNMNMLSPNRLDAAVFALTELMIIDDEPAPLTYTYSDQIPDDWRRG